jgi:hypothetical protein
MFFRLHFLFRSIFNNSIYRDEYSKKICNHHGIKSGIRFTFKCFLETYPDRTILGLFVTSIMILAYFLRVFELPYQIYTTPLEKRLPLAEEYFCYIYLMIVTITTVGYGDITAKTIVGKFTLMISSIWGAFLISFIILVVTNNFDLKK